MTVLVTLPTVTRTRTRDLFTDKSADSDSDGCAAAVKSAPCGDDAANGRQLRRNIYNGVVSRDKKPTYNLYTRVKMKISVPIGVTGALDTFSHCPNYTIARHSELLNVVTMALLVSRSTALRRQGTTVKASNLRGHRIQDTGFPDVAKRR